MVESLTDLQMDSNLEIGKTGQLQELESAGTSRKLPWQEVRLTKIMPATVTLQYCHRYIQPLKARKSSQELTT